MQNWYDCVDIRVVDDDGIVLYDGPKFLRCKAEECGAIVTMGQIETHGTCVCGFRRFRQAVKLKESEKHALMTGKHILSAWETVMIGDNDI